ncbi:MAG TPA: ABC transporter substrate-binding protein [Candidatus Cybelea sp.]|nr:ABC transporter substrate-binding protein [Candidatus Cybelea sp.]
MRQSAAGTTRAAAGISAALVIGMAAGHALAADAVKVGVIFPLTGNAASAGASAKAAVELAVEIVNGTDKDYGKIPGAGLGGLPALGGAKIELDEADHQGNPSVGQSQTLRLITQDKVVAMLGAYQSNVSFTATAVAEKYGIPFVVGDSVALNITNRGYQWVFRVTPVASDFANNYMEFLKDMTKAGHKVETLAVVNENTDYGTSVAGTVLEVAKSHGLNVVAQIPYAANGTDVSAQVLQLKEKKPDAVIFISYTADTILYFKTMKALDYLPPMIIGDDSGFSDPSFIPSVGDLAQGAMNRSAWDIGKPGSVTSKINDKFKAKTGHEMDDTSARDMQAMFVLADAINRAGSADPAKLQAALKATDLKPDQIIMGYRGVKFDQTGQNTEAATYLIQLQGKQYVAVWPQETATAKLAWPMTGWK